VYPIGTPGIVVASHVHVAHARDSLVVEALHDFGGVEAHEHVVVPCVAVGVHEHDRVGEVVIVVDNVAQIYLLLSLAVNASSTATCAHTIASRPLFLGTLFSALGLSTS
jgi:hypothetical protein